MPSLAVIAFPGNNCEIESLRAAERNGFSTELIKWNELEKVGNADAYFLPGGFSFEDRGRSGAISAREKIFESLRTEARKGKLILGVCNGAQMVTESGLIPVGDNPLPFALAHNIRRDERGHVLGTGFYNEWAYLKAERTDTAFTYKVDQILRVPIAHGEGRFSSVDSVAQEALKSGASVAFRYCDKDGKVSDKFPITPNGALHATAAITNQEGTICAIMPHPERFFDNFDGDQVFKSMYQWILDKKSPETVTIGDFSLLSAPEIKDFEPTDNAVYLEKKLMITDNENFSIKSATESLLGESISLEKSILFEVLGENLSQKELEETHLFFNPNKEFLVEANVPSSSKFMVKDFQNDEADHLAEQLSTLLGKKISVNIFKAWDFGNTDQNLIATVLQNRILCNPNSSALFKI